MCTRVGLIGHDPGQSKRNVLLITDIRPHMIEKNKGLCAFFKFEKKVVHICKNTVQNRYGEGQLTHYPIGDVLVIIKV